MGHWEPLIRFVQVLSRAFSIKWDETYVEEKATSLVPVMVPVMARLWVYLRDFLLV